jgi:enoyl-CoA hydratase/carnithine racemase
MDYEQILAETSDGVLTITLNRPERLNAWTAQMGLELRAAFDRADGDDEVRAIVLTGAGRGFCAGADDGHGLVAQHARGDRARGPVERAGPT